MDTKAYARERGWFIHYVREAAISYRYMKELRG